MTERIFNFSSGPAVLPLPVLGRLQDLTAPDYRCTMSRFDPLVSSAS